MTQRTRILIAAGVLFVLVAVILGIDALQRASGEPSAEGEPTVTAGAVPIRLDGKLVGSFTPADLERLEKVSFVEPEEGKTQQGWLLRDVIDLAEAEVVDVTITHPDGETIHVSRVSADVTDFTLDDIPKGREVESSWAVNGLGGSLAAVLLEEVAPADQLDWSKATHLRVLTADGVEARAEVVTLDGKSWLKLAVFPYPEQKDEPVEGGTTELAVADQLKRIEGINKRVRGWAYSIPEFKAELMTKRKEGLLKPLAKK